MDVIDAKPLPARGGDLPLLYIISSGGLPDDGWGFFGASFLRGLPGAVRPEIGRARERVSRVRLPGGVGGGAGRK